MRVRTYSTPFFVISKSVRFFKKYVLSKLRTFKNTYFQKYALFQKLRTFSKITYFQKYALFQKLRTFQKYVLSKLRTFQKLRIFKKSQFKSIFQIRVTPI